MAAKRLGTLTSVALLSVGVAWLLSIPFAPFFGRLLTSAVDVTRTNWPWLLGADRQRAAAPSLRPPWNRGRELVRSRAVLSAKELRSSSCGEGSGARSTSDRRKSSSSRLRASARLWSPRIAHQAIHVDRSVFFTTAAHDVCHRPEREAQTKDVAPHRSENEHSSNSPRANHVQPNSLREHRSATANPPVARRAWLFEKTTDFRNTSAPAPPRDVSAPPTLAVRTVGCRYLKRPATRPSIAFARWLS